ncbi:HAD hydrolase-like protein [Chitinispirillales bacterium ANBcel5]|uniref:HAD family hydrolase n=1 Tax=Cellulosispirillum alkaliphilum TaxID=3039283 RepID=UPI002A4EBF77|nr:HAD hydrolase-like protein [Chitinispirillales bacterium ANBcel5]
MKDYSYYLFDADGTLFDTADMIYSCFEDTFKRFDLNPVPKEMIYSHIGLPLRDQLEVYIGNVDDVFYRRYRAAHMKHQLEIFRDYLVLFNGVRETLVQLKDRGKRCAVVTSRMKESLRMFLDELSILESFEVFVTPESTENHKPHPQPAFEALKLLGATEQSDAIFIGDSSFDIECGNSAGMDTAFVNWSKIDPKTLSVKPTYILNSMADLLCSKKASLRL